MSSIRIVVGVVWVVLVMVSGRIWTASAGSIPPGAIVEPIGATTAVSDLSTEPVPEPDRSPARRVDMYGNEIEDAVTEYRIDVRGDLYERHAPQTALPRPKRPGA